jgi:hypothetical protein
MLPCGSVQFTAVAASGDVLQPPLPRHHHASVAIQQFAVALIQPSSTHHTYPERLINTESCKCVQHKQWKQRGTMQSKQC